MDTALYTPLFRVADDVYLKCEFLHVGRSHKARVARALIDDAEQCGRIRPGQRKLLERTGGNLGIALAIEARVRGYELVLVTDPHYSAVKKDMAARLGAKVIDRGVEYPECTDNQQVVDILLAKHPDTYFYLNQFGNPANPRAHETGTGAELLAQLVDRGYGRESTVVLVGGLGTGASMCGISRALRGWFHAVVTLGVQPPNCDLLADKYGEHGLQGIAVGQPAPFFAARELDGILPVTENHALQAARDLLAEHRFLVGPSSAANYAALNEAARHPAAAVAGRRLLLTILYDRGEDYAGQEGW